MKKFVRVLYSAPWVLTVTLITVISVLCLIPGSSQPHMPAGTDKVVHAVMYVALAFSMSMDFGGGMRSRRNASARMFAAQCGWIAASLFGGLIEVLQWWMDMGRAAEWADWAADVIGGAVGAIMAYLMLAQARDK